jgi:DNA-binding Lrp family transcriptional regulator
MINHSMVSSKYDRLMTTLDDIDWAMIDALRADGRISIPALAERVGVSRATAYHRFDRLVDTGVITGFTALVNPVSVGVGVSAMIMINVRQGQWRALLGRLQELAGVEWLGVATGSFDFIVHARATSLEHLRDVVLHEIQAIDDIRSSETIVLLDEVDQRHRPIVRGAPPAA